MHIFIFVNIIYVVLFNVLLYTVVLKKKKHRPVWVAKPRVQSVRIARNLKYTYYRWKQSPSNISFAHGHQLVKLRHWLVVYHVRHVIDARGKKSDDSTRGRANKLTRFRSFTKKKNVTYWFYDENFR